MRNSNIQASTTNSVRVDVQLTRFVNMNLKEDQYGFILFECVSDVSGSVYTDVAPIKIVAPGCGASKNDLFSVSLGDTNDDMNAYQFDYNFGSSLENAPMKQSISISVTHSTGYDECPVTCEIIANSAPTHFSAEIIRYSNNLWYLDIYSIND